MDETAVEVGVGGQAVLARRGDKVNYSVTGSTRLHVTAAYTVTASGKMVPVRCVYQGVRNVAQQHLKDLSTEGLSGAWQFSVTEKGYVVQETFVTILEDLDKFLTSQDIKRPILLLIDGAAPHIGLGMAKFCKEKGIQPWLLKPNTTNLLQPLDLTFFSSLKTNFRRLQQEWQHVPQNIGISLSKYGVIPLLRRATEYILSTKPNCISNGFRRAGIVPWNLAALDLAKMAPSSVFAPPDDNIVSCSNVVVQDFLTLKPPTSQSQEQGCCIKEAEKEIGEDKTEKEVG